MRSGFKRFAMFDALGAALASAFIGEGKTPFGTSSPFRAENPRYDRAPSSYMPHQGIKERARRRGQMAKAAAKKEILNG